MHQGNSVPVFRFAPSPNGLLHLGHAYSALTNLRLARASGARILLRIEDIDTARCRPHFEKQMLEDLEWIGFEWDEPPMRQSAQFDRYRAAVEELIDADLLYPSTLSRRQIMEAVEAKTAAGLSWPSDPDGAPFYPGHERQLPPRERLDIIESGADHALRLDLPAALDRLRGDLVWAETGSGPQGQAGLIEACPQQWGDVVLARKDVPASFHLCVCLDDAFQEVTHIARGQDLFWSTGVHRLLQELLALPIPQYHHHELILDETGRKLSKSRGDTALLHLREAGMTRRDIIRMIGLD